MINYKVLIADENGEFGAECKRLYGKRTEGKADELGVYSYARGQNKIKA